MRRYATLRRRSDFARVQRRGKRQVGPLFVFLTTEARERSRAGITVSKHVGNAVVRNRLRRRVKAVLDRAGFGTPPFRDVLFIAKPGAGEATFEHLAHEIGRLLA